jgi:ABC-type transporter Mla subunit MlaD
VALNFNLIVMSLFSSSTKVEDERLKSDEVDTTIEEILNNFSATIQRLTNLKNNVKKFVNQNNEKIQDLQAENRILNEQITQAENIINKLTTLISG